ncbi:MAG TPA: DNA repair protein RadA [Acidimicrobiales bacterium]|nr:DNA repair protein RadA [Acidimicrobiales bacterium]
MAQTRTVHRCSECGEAAPKWTGQCAACEQWGTLIEEVDSGRPGPVVAAHHEAPVPIGDVDLTAWAPRATLVAELDRVLSGGLVPGSATLVGGEPGIGKSTLLLQAAAGIAHTGESVLYISAEESVQQVRLRAERLDAITENLWLVNETDLDAMLQRIDELGPTMVIIDSIQTTHDTALGSAPGSVAQVRSCAHRLVQAAKQRSLTLVLVGHVTKDGGLAGPRVLEHLVDTVLAFEGDRHHALRLLRASKHRFGATSELGLFEMTAVGLVGVPDPSALFLADRRPGTSGSVVVPTLDGTRPVLIEVQALVDKSTLPVPRRSAQGIDAGRLNIVLAVLERRCGANIAGRDIYVATAGGARSLEPSVDLAMSLAVVSAGRDRPVARDLVAVGEVGLGGEIRQVAQIQRRLEEAARLGFRSAIAPRDAPQAEGIETIRVGSLAEAIEATGLQR